MNHPLAEIFGLKYDDISVKAEKSRREKLCPFHNSDPKCTKDKKGNPLAVCSIHHDDDVTITCPVRFRERWAICKDAADFFFPKNAEWTPLKEIRLKDGSGESAGNIDMVIVSHDSKGRVLDFGAVEVQAVYVSGNVRRPFERYMSNPAQNWNMDWTDEPNYPKPDYLSSSRKRLAPQLMYKGRILDAWGKKQAIVVDAPFFDTLPELPVCTKEKAEICWMVYSLQQRPAQRGYTLTMDKKVYAGFEPTIETIGKPAIGSPDAFIETLNEKLSVELKQLRSLHGVNSFSELLRKFPSGDFEVDFKSSSEIRGLNEPQP